MHEVDMTKALLQTLYDWWQAAACPVVQEVHLQVGEFTCVEPQSLQTAFAAAVPGTFLAHCTLHIESIPLVGYCHRCGHTYQPQLEQAYACPTCHDPLTDIVSGRELKIAHIVTAPDAYAQNC
ncbi:hydrogenase maturation nickel metallochaperone HypA [Thermosynechococcus sp. FA-CM-4201]